MKEASGSEHKVNFLSCVVYSFHYYNYISATVVLVLVMMVLAIMMKGNSLWMFVFSESGIWEQ
jgi:hypothetical protein